MKPDDPTTRHGRVLALMAGDPGPLRSMSIGDWTELLAVAGGDLQPWLAYQMGALELTATVPPAVQATVQATRVASAIRVLRRGHAFARTVRSLDAAGIPVVVLKGMALAWSVYPEPWTRPMTDMDLWIEPHRRAEAWPCLEAAGWRVPDAYRVFGGRSESKPWILELPDLRQRLEVHAVPESIAARPAIEWPPVWERREQQQVAGVTVGVLGLADQIAHLAIHLARGHGFANGLRRLLDVTLVAGTVRHADEWSALGAAHRSTGVAPWTVVTLDLARRLLGAPVPDVYFDMAMIAPPTPTLIAAACEQLWHREAASGAETVITQRHGSALRAVWTHLRNYYAAPPAEGQNRIAAVLWRTSWHLTSRLPRYTKMLLEGELRPERVAYRARMLKEQEALRQAVEALGAPPVPPSADPAPPPSSR